MGTKQISINERMIRSILIVHRSSICEFTCSLKFHCNSICCAFDMGMDALSSKNVSHSMHVFHLRLKKTNLTFCFSSHTVNKHLFSYLVSIMFLEFLCFVLLLFLFLFICLFLVILPFKVVPKCYRVFLRPRRLECALLRK